MESIIHILTTNRQRNAEKYFKKNGADLLFAQTEKIKRILRKQFDRTSMVKQTYVGVTELDELRGQDEDGHKATIKIGGINI